MIYIVSHIDRQLPRLEGYRPIQVGGAEDFPGWLRDNAGDNISDRNASYCELTALYWVWKNAGDDCKGLVHYRRYFGRRRFSSRTRDICGYEELRAMLKRWDVVAARPAVYHVTAREQLCMECCTSETFERLEAIFLAMYPDYAADFHSFFAGNRASQYNMLFCGRERFDAYCAWLFPILFELERQVDLSAMNAYQRRLFGFLSERLMNVWMAHNGLKVKYLPVVSTDYSLRDHITYFRRDLTNQIRFSLRKRIR